MHYKDRLEKMRRNGTLSEQQAHEFSAILEKLAVEKSIAAPKPRISYVKVSLCILLMLAIGIFAISVTAPSAEVKTQEIQDVRSSLNQSGATEQLPDTASTMLSLFLLLSIPAALTMCLVAARYNRLIALEESVQKTAACIASAMQRKKELLPALEKLVESAMRFEETLQHSTAEACAGHATALKHSLEETRQNSQHMQPLAATLHTVLEAYPGLRSHDNLEYLQRELSNVEQDMHIARMIHTEATAELNAYTRSIFGSWVARLCGLSARRQTLS